MAVAFPYGLALVRVGRGRRLPDWAGHVVPPAHTHTYIVRHLEHTHNRCGRAGFVEERESDERES